MPERASHSSFYAEPPVLQCLLEELRREFAGSEVHEVFAYGSDGVVLECFIPPGHWSYLAVTWTVPAVFRLCSSLPKRPRLAPGPIRNALRGRQVASLSLSPPDLLILALEPCAEVILRLDARNGWAIVRERTATDWAIVASQGRPPEEILLRASPQFEPGLPAERAPAAPRFWIRYDRSQPILRPVRICGGDSLSPSALPEAEIFDTPSAALETFLHQLLRYRAFAEGKSEVEKVLRRRLKKLQRLQENLRRDLIEAGEAERYQLFGNLLLANVGQNPRGEGMVRLPDFDGNGLVDIPLDPSKNRVENAEAYFHLARKLRRKAEVASARLRLTQAEIEACEQQLARLPSVTNFQELQEIQEIVCRPEKGEQHPIGKEARKPSASRSDSRILRFRSADGLEILAGRSAEGNDYLTFQIAREHDFWFHVAGGSGAHVVVRNPQRLAKCPPRTAEQAAALAAYLSKFRQSNSATVLMTQRRHLKRPRGRAPGEVVLKAFESLTVKPALPSPGTEDAVE